MKYRFTPRGEVSPGLPRLLAHMHASGEAFNAVIFAAGSDVSALALIDNGVGWEAVSESSTNDDSPLFDLWFMGQLIRPAVDLESAARFLLDQYREAKYARVLARSTGEILQ